MAKRCLVIGEFSLFYQATEAFLCLTFNIRVYFMCSGHFL